MKADTLKRQPQVSQICLMLQRSHQFSHEMGLSSLLFYLLLLLTQFAFSSAADSTRLVYKGCANQSFHDPNGVYSQALSGLFGALVSASTKSKFYKTTAGSGQATITGLFQCRGDLTISECYRCVSNLPVLTDKICGSAIAARIQLYGCYLLYEVAGFNEVSGMEMLFKSCGSSTLAGGGFEEKRDTALSALASGVVSGHGFYTSSYQSVYILGQCEGDIQDSDCGACAKVAIQRAQVECGNSISAQIYLNKCYISYSYYPNGAPKKPSFMSSSSPNSDTPASGQNVGRTVAIILGAAAGVGLLIIILMFARGLMKNHDDS